MFSFVVALTRAACDGGGSFIQWLEVGLRHDGSLRYASASGLSIEASLRRLLAHEA